MRGILPVSAFGAGHKSTRSFFSSLAANTSHFAGRASAFLLALFVVVIWAISGPFFNYSDTWQLVINTGTTIVTFLMVFLIQHTQNRDTRALQLNLDELHCDAGRTNSMASIEEASKMNSMKRKTRSGRRRATDQEQRNWEADPARDKYVAFSRAEPAKGSDLVALGRDDEPSDHFPAMKSRTHRIIALSLPGSN